MKKIPVVFAICALVSVTSTFSQKADPKYFDEIPPGTTPKVFAPGKISTKEVFEFGAVFNSDRTEFYYGVEINGKAETRMRKFANAKWSAATTLLSHETYSFNDPFLTPDNQKLFFISNRPFTGTGPKKDYDIWYIEREGNKWSAPKNAGPNINTDQNEYYISFTNTGKMYFSSNGKPGKPHHDIYSSEFKNGAFQESVNLGQNINTNEYEADVFVAPDESYLVFAANREGGLGSGDLFVSFRGEDGTWTKAKSLGNSINTETDDFCPYVTPDGKYLIYASRGDIYWVDVSVIFKVK